MSLSSNRVIGEALAVRQAVEQTLGVVVDTRVGISCIFHVEAPEVKRDVKSGLKIRAKQNYERTNRRKEAEEPRLSPLGASKR